MTREATRSRFEARLRRPREAGDGDPWAFVVLPAEASAKLPRRGRLTVDATIDGLGFRALLEPDGRKGHWLRLDETLLRAAGADYGDVVTFEIVAAEREPDPDVPADLAEALRAAPEARSTWKGTTTLARVDWIHWITSARQAKTRAKRIGDACDMLASGKKRVCCFDPSGYYSKAFSAPEAAD
ncbi:YdeI/OmpD-associated family protein [Salinisphaera sp. PC39]|uniref:YdeI/OmpD-associated family protein n=1 Tax=Salinisphaera sp. PC39 TaxID=1304156 RepID=UPI00333F0AA4